VSFTSSPSPAFEQFYAVRRFRSTLEFTPDSTGLLVSINISGQFNLWRLPVEGGWPSQLTTLEDQTVRSVAPAPDGETIVFSADRDGDEFHQLYAIAASGGWPVAWTEATQVQHHLAESASWDPEGRRLAFAANSRTPTDMDVWVRDSATGEVSHVSGDGRYAALLWSQPERADELYVVELATGQSRRLTDNMLGGLAPDQLATPALIRYDSADDLRVPAWVYRPDGPNRPDLPGRLPVVLSIHGGPEGQERPEYNPLYQYLCSRGIAVLAPNIRGSTGYGKSYQRMIHRDWGGGDLADLRHAVEWLRAQDWVDADRIGVYGGSYGGFATLSCVTRLPEYWAAAAGRERPDGGADARARPGGGVRGLRGRGARVHPPCQPAARDAAHRRLVHPASEWDRLTGKRGCRRRAGSG
jgi:dipeptidyl aminopeptidase/acylaminoacyl peptidase